MVELIRTFYGDWIYDTNRWLFKVDDNYGSRDLKIDLGIRLEDFKPKVLLSYGVDVNRFEINLSYMSMKKKSDPSNDVRKPMFVVTNRDFDEFLLNCETKRATVCVSVKAKNETVKPHVKIELNDRKRHGERYVEENESDYGANDLSDNGNESDDDDWERFDCCDDSDGASSGDEDYTIHGVVNNEDEAEQVLPTKKKIQNWGYENFDEASQAVEISALNLAVGQRYDSKKALKTRLKMLSVIHQFDYDVDRSSTKLLIVHCWVKNCIWRVRASPVGDNDTFTIRVLVDKHTCSVTERAGRTRQGSHKILGHLYKDFVGGVGPTITPQHLADALRIRYRVRVEYWKAHRALQHARTLVRGSPESGYEDLPKYLYQIRQANPGTYTRLEVDDNNRFKYLFIAFGASIYGSQYMRKVLVVDGTFLQGKYKGTLLVATAQDGNFQIFPIAFAIVDTENDDSWEWFFRQMSTVMPDDRNLAIISDRHQSIGKAIETVYPMSTRGICTYHLYKNIIVRFRGVENFRLVKKAARACRLSEFTTLFEEIAYLNPALHAYLVRADVKYWSRVHFPGDRYNILTTNIAESINRVLSKSRSLPITLLLDEIRMMLTRWFSERRNDAASMQTVLTRGVEKLLKARVEKAKDFPVQQINSDLFEVTNGTSVNVVNLNLKKCTCCLFDKEKIPCVHAIAAAEANKISTIQQCHEEYRTSYLRSGYSLAIMPRDRALPVPEKVDSMICIPPIVRQLPGRPKKGESNQPLNELWKRKKLEKKAIARNAKKEAITSGPVRNSLRMLLAFVFSFEVDYNYLK